MAKAGLGTEQGKKKKNGRTCKHMSGTARNNLPVWQEILPATHLTGVAEAKESSGSSNGLKCSCIPRHGSGVNLDIIIGSCLYQVNTIDLDWQHRGFQLLKIYATRDSRMCILGLLNASMYSTIELRVLHSSQAHISKPGWLTMKLTEIAAPGGSTHLHPHTHPHCPSPHSLD